LVAEDLHVSYGDICALRHVNLAINRGCVTALVGPSGCGKSSFLQSLNRLTDLMPRCTVRGKLELEGKSVLDPQRDVVALRREVGMIFQRPNPFPFSIRRNFSIPLREHGMRHHADVESAMEASLRSVGLWEEVKDRLERSATALSGGQQQRLCLARALVLKPKVLLLDEPCSALDPGSTELIEDLISQLRMRYTVVMATHNLAQARRIADFVAVFWVQNNAGLLVESGKTDQVFGAPENEWSRAYLSGRRG
jgi:phosphate transport system ATP-binding protein